MSLLDHFLCRKPIARAAFNIRPISRPWGGGNQWLTQLTSHLLRCGFGVRFGLHPEIDCIVLTHMGLSGSLQFSLDELIAFRKENPRVAVLHRINDNDIRKNTGGMDALLDAWNRAADHTVFVSKWLREYHADRWFDSSQPHTIISPGAEPDAFHPVGSRTWNGHEPLRIVTHHWSDNWIKGFGVYRQLDEAIASGKLRDTELWVIGRWPAEIQWKSTRTFPPARGRSLGQLLRQCHVYITASLWEPGAMHVAEGLQCGLPLLYHRDSGGSVEVGRRYGVEFADDLLSAVEQMRLRYPDLRQRVLSNPPSGDLMCAEYRRLIQQLIVTRS